MSLDVMPLFEPLTIEDKTLPNRIVMPPMASCRDLRTAEGIEWYGRHAAGGVGLVIVEAKHVDAFGTEFTDENLKPLVQAIHAEGALAAFQLFPATFGKSAPAGLSGDEIDEIIDQYEVATQICAEAGFDGVEPHGAHHYLLNQFFSPVKNQREDAYGGCLQDRMRLGTDIVRAIRPICDAEGMLLLYRHTPVGEGYGIAESVQLGEALVDAGVDILDLSPSSIEAPGDRAAPFRPLGVPLIAVGRLDVAARALEVLNENRADLVAIGRGLIADPDWPIKVKDGRYDEIVRCIRCDEKCHGNLRQGIPIACTQW
jgi:2,4-dienoyl-CoA reductase-like NADH-dependent reductase (Old Yellow Enzyme family)